MVVKDFETYSFDNGQIEIEEAKGGWHNPDVDNGDEGKDNGPEEGCGYGHKGGEDLVEPGLGLGEHHKSQLPYPFKSNSSTGFSQNIREVELQCNKKINYTLIINSKHVLKMASGETIRQSYECSPLLCIFLCVKMPNFVDS